jgi:hypothetical protein
MTSCAAALAVVLALGSSLDARLVPETPAADKELEQAKELYRSGRFAQAIVKLQATIGRLEPPPRTPTKDAQLAEAHLHMALSLIALDDPVAARESLKAMLRRDPGRRLDPQVHAPKVIALLDEARAELAAEPAAQPPKRGSRTAPIVVAAGAAAAGLVVALGKGGGSGAPPSPAATPTPAPMPTSSPTAPPEAQPQSALFVGSSPPPGSTITVGQQTLMVTLAFLYNTTGVRGVLASLRTAGNTSCASGTTTSSFAGGQFQEVTVAVNPAPASAAPACALPLETVTLAACGSTEQVPGTFRCISTFAVSYRFVQ